MKEIILILSIVAGVAIGQQCTCSPSITIASGTAAPSNFRSGELIFEENFNNIDLTKWRPLNSLSGGGTNEFQWFTNDTENLFAKGGNLNIRPSLTADVFGESFLTSGRVVVPPSECTATWNNGCNKQGTPDNIINPIRSGGLETRNSFSFKYGTVEVRAKFPAGDWIWPKILLKPRRDVYGAFPRSGAIYHPIIRGNRALFNGNTQIGNQFAQSYIQFGPSEQLKNYPFGRFTPKRASGFDDGFRLFKIVWTPVRIEFFIDNISVGAADVGTGLYNQAAFASSGLPNPWVAGGLMAPFDQEFYLNIDSAVGGDTLFNDYYRNGNGAKPWLNDSPRAAADFWAGRSQWLPTWNLNTDDTNFQVDYVRVWAL